MKKINLLLSVLVINLSVSEVYSQGGDQTQKFFETQLKRALIKEVVNSIIDTDEDLNNQFVEVIQNNNNYGAPTVVVKMNDGNIITCSPCVINMRNNRGVLILPPGGSENIIMDPNTFYKFYSSGPEIQRYSSHIVGDLVLTSGKTLNNVALEGLYLKGRISGYSTILDTEFVVGDNYSLSNSRVKLVSEIEFNLR